VIESLTLIVVAAPPCPEGPKVGRWRLGACHTMRGDDLGSEPTRITGVSEESAAILPSAVTVRLCEGRIGPRVELSTARPCGVRVDEPHTSGYKASNKQRMPPGHCIGTLSTAASLPAPPRVCRDRALFSPLKIQTIGRCVRGRRQNVAAIGGDIECYPGTGRTAAMTARFPDRNIMARRP